MPESKTSGRVQIELDDFTVTVEGGVFCETSSWTTHLTFSMEKFGAFAPAKHWDNHEVIVDENDLREFAWQEVLDILQKYSKTKVEVFAIEDIIDAEVVDDEQ